MSSKKTTTKSKKPIWDAKLTKELADLKKLALKNKSLFICGVSMDEKGNVEGVFFSDGISPVLIAETIMSELPFDAIQVAMVKCALRGQLKDTEHTKDCPLYKGLKTAKKPIKKAKK